MRHDSPTGRGPVVRLIRRDEPCYPSALHDYLGDRAPKAIAARGETAILRQRKLGFFCSVKCPGDLIIQTYDLACALRDGGVTVIGGFHSPMEKECLALLLKGTQPVIVCPARGLDRMRVPAEWKAPLAEGRLLVLSPFQKPRRPTAELAQRRNEFVAALADAVLIAHARPGSKTETFCRAVLAWGKPVLTLESPENAELAGLGAKAVQPEEAVEALA